MEASHLEVVNHKDSVEIMQHSAILGPLNIVIVLMEDGELLPPKGGSFLLHRNNLH